MPKYTLMNPAIVGTLSSTFSGNDSLDAATTAWNALSKYMTNNVPKFAFTLEDTKGKLHHFKIAEKLSGGGSASYKIEEIDVKQEPKDVQAFKDRVSAFRKSKAQAGGKKHRKHDDDDDSSSSSSEAFSALKLYKQATKPWPIGYWWYDPFVYRFDSLYIPTFVAPLTPYIEIATVTYPSYYY